MILKLREKMFREGPREKGSTTVETVFMMPIAIFILFAMINLSSYFSVRAQVENVAREGARLVALYGGQSTNAIRNTSGESVENQVMDLIWDSETNQCEFSFCESAGNGNQRQPVVSCTPNIARNAGEIVECTIQYWYSPLAPVPSGLEGLNGVFGQPITVSVTYVSETGQRG